MTNWNNRIKELNERIERLIGIIYGYDSSNFIIS